MFDDEFVFPWREMQGFTPHSEKMAFVVVERCFGGNKKSSIVVFIVFIGYETAANGYIVFQCPLFEACHCIAVYCFGQICTIHRESGSAHLR